ncbi:MAG: tetratricopeptide repeat protein [Phycisphaerae bacterium]|nr:tetratricopeptide repeat protein [Phycisphaerae bacterium]
MAQRRLNKNLVVGLVLGLMLVLSVGAIGLLLAVRGPADDPGPFVRMAEKAARTGNYENAVRAYGQAFGRTRDPIWLVAQGNMSREMGDALGALRAWDRAVTEDPGQIAAHEARIRLRLELVALYGGAQHYIALREASDALLSRIPENPLGHFGKGIALTGLEQEDPQNMAKGIAEMEKAHELSPGDRDISESLARVYEMTASNRLIEKKEKESQEYRDKADEVYGQMIKADPENPVAYLSYASFLMRRLNADVVRARTRRRTFSEASKTAALKRVDELLKKVEGMTPNDPELGTARAEYWRLADKPEQVAATWEGIIKTAPDYLAAYLNLANRYGGQGELKKSLAILEKGLSREVDVKGYKGGRNRFNRFQMLRLSSELELLLAQGSQGDEREAHLIKAEEFRDQAAAEGSATDPAVLQLEGQICEARGKYREARRAYEGADSVLRWDKQQQRAYKIQNLLRMAELYLQHLQAPGEAVSVLNTVLQQTQHPRAFLLRCKARLSLGEPEKAVDDAKIVLSMGDRVTDQRILNEAKLLAMQGYSQMGKIDEVKKLQAGLGGETPQDKLRQAVIYQLDKQNDKAAAAYKALLDESPASRAYLQRAIGFFLSIDKREEAVKLLSAAQKASPADQGLKQLALLLDDKLKPEERDQRMLALIEETENEYARELALYQFYARKQDVAKAMEHLEKARKTEAGASSSQLLQLEFGLALNQRDWDRAKRCWEQAVHMDADGVGGRFYLGRISLTQAGIAQAEAQKLAPTDAAKSRAKSEEAKKLFGEAATQLREGINIYDKSSLAYLMLGEAEEGQGNLVDARDAYTVAADLDPTNAGAQRALAKMGRTYQNVADTEDHLKAAIRLWPKDRSGLPLDWWLRLQVENEREKEDPDSAIVRREAERKKAPKDVYNLMRLALLYEGKKEYGKADSCVLDALKAGPDNLTLSWDASRYYCRRNQPAKAQELLTKQVKAADKADKWRAQEMLARHYDSLWRAYLEEKPPNVEGMRQARESADREYAVAIQLPGAPPQVYVEAASFCERTGRRPASMEWLRRALEVTKEKSYEAQIRRRLIRLLLTERPVPPEAEGEVEKYAEAFPDDPIGLLFAGELRAAQGKLRRAIEDHTAYLDKISGQAKGPTQSARMAEGYFLRGQLYLRQARSTYEGRDDLLRLAIRDLTHAKTIAPQDSRPRVLLARAYELLGQADKGIRELKAVLTDKPGETSAARELVRLYAQLKQWPEQESLIRQQMNLFPEEALWPYLLGTQLEERGKRSEAVVALKQACDLIKYEVSPNRGQRQPVVALLRVLNETKRYDEIIKTINEKVKAEARTSDVWSYFGGALAHTGKPGEALSHFQKAASVSPSFAAYRRCAQECSRSLGLAEAITALSAEHKKDPKNAVASLLLSTLLANDKKPSEALQLLGQAVAEAKDPGIQAIALTYQGMLLYDSGKMEEASEAYIGALRIKGDDLTVLNNLAFTLAESLKRPKDAVGYAQFAYRLAPDNPLVLDTLGWCLFLIGRSQDALGVLLEAIDRDPKLLDAHIHLARLYAKDGQKDKAANQLREILKDVEERGDQAGKTRLEAVMKELGIES